MALVPVSEVEKVFTPLTAEALSERLRAADVALPLGWSVVAARMGTVEVAFAEEGGLATGWGGQTLPEDELDRVTIVNRTRLSVTYVVMTGGTRTAWLEIVDLAAPLGEAYASAHLGLRPARRLPRGVAVVGGPAGFIRLGRYAIRVTLSAGQAPIDLNEVERWASELQASTTGLVTALGS